MKTGYMTSKSPYEDIHFGDIVERYKGSGHEKVVFRIFRSWWGEFSFVGLKPSNGKSFPMPKVGRIIKKVGKR